MCTPAYMYNGDSLPKSLDKLLSYSGPVVSSPERETITTFMVSIRAATCIHTSLSTPHSP